MNAQAVERLAPAKVNLSFRILRKREDGFHEVETLMVPIRLADRLRIEIREGEQIDLACSDPTLPAGDDNLVIKAARAFCAEADWRPGLHIELEKKVPHGAGLGGGSSDAAASLLGLNTLSGNRLSLDQLSAIAARLGSDIPFFLYESAALCRGRGEQVKPVPFAERVRLLLMKPPFGVATPWAYSRWKDSQPLPGVDYGSQAMPWGEMVNDLERPVFEKYVLLAELKQWLRAKSDLVAGALMSGSGSTTFAVLRENADAAPLIRDIHERYGDRMWTCETEVAV